MSPTLVYKKLYEQVLPINRLLLSSSTATAVCSFCAYSILYMRIQGWECEISEAALVKTKVQWNMNGWIRGGYSNTKKKIV